jgi:membrane protease YdiL (CAAX protease family)
MREDAKKLLAVNLLYALIPVLLLLIPQMTGRMEMAAYGAQYSAIMVALEFGVIALPTLIYFVTPWGRELARHFWAQRPTAGIFLVIPLAICAYFLVTGITALWIAMLGALGMTAPPQSAPLPATAGQLGVSVLVIGLVPALCEEFFFRGTLQPVLSRHLRPWAAIVLCGCLFGLIHGQLAALPGHVLLGIGLCLVAYWTRSIWYTVLWHFLQNSLAMGMGYLSSTLLHEAEALGGVEAQAAQAGDPLLLLVGGLMLIVPFAIGTAVFLVLLYLTTKRHRETPVACAQARPSFLCWTPLLIALACAVYMYVTSGAAMLGGGV